MPILEVEGLVKSYARRRVVDGVELFVEPGEIVGLLGPNGAGKTTTFRMICGMVKPDKGRVFLQDADVTRWPMYMRARKGGMGYLPQQSSVFTKLSAQDNLYGTMQLLGFSRKQQKFRCEELLDQFKIAHIRKTKAGRLSGGERRRLEIARCLVSEPKIIMLDEPFAGIDPVTVQSIQIVIKELAEHGIAILITDHAAREILQTTDRTYVVSEGQILVSGSADEIVAHDQVREKYLGDIALPNETLPRTERRPAAEPKTVAEETSSVTTVPFDNPAPIVESPRPDEVVQVEERSKKMVFSKPRRKTRRINAPFKSTDLD